MVNVPPYQEKYTKKKKLSDFMKGTFPERNRNLEPRHVSFLLHRHAVSSQINIYTYNSHNFLESDKSRNQKIFS